MPSSAPIASMTYSLKGIENFVRTAEKGSFAKAALELGVTPVAVSDNISRLERSLGVRLFARSTRHLQLTPEGQALLEQCSKPLRELDAACRETASSTTNPQGLVRVTMVSAVGHLFVVPELPKFYARYPGVTLQLDLNDETTGLIAQRFDVGIRVGQLDDASFVARPLGPLRLPMVASPGYLAAHGAPRSLDELSQHVLMQQAIPAGNTARDLATAPEATRWAVTVAAFGQKLRNDPWLDAGYGWDQILDQAQGARGEDPFGDRAEFVQLVRAAQGLPARTEP